MSNSNLIAAKKLTVHKLPDNDGKTESVETQSELVKALKNGARLIYGDEFRIPLNLHGITYIGCENAVIDLDAEADVDLDASEIILENLQVYLRHPIALKFDKSKNIKILDGSKKAPASNVSLNEILHVLRGRNAFESLENFKTRAEGIQGVAVGSTLLEDSNYDFDAARFLFNPRWDFEYITFRKDFASGKIFYIKIQPNDAEMLYNNERKLTILKLYFDTKTFGRIEIIRTEMISLSGSDFGRGYGLKIITEYQN